MNLCISIFYQVFVPSARLKNIILPLNSTFIIKIKIKTVKLLFVWANNWGAVCAVNKNIIGYYYNNLLLRTTKIICKSKIKGHCFSDKTRFRKSYQYKFLLIRFKVLHVYDLYHLYHR